ncbi:MAG: tetratricopeptide repeat protein, partial [Candidatus Omnitrophota bacterium]
MNLIKLTLAKFVLLFLIIIIIFAIPAFAETIVLKSGEKINANVIEKNDNYVKLDVKGSLIVYRTFEIQSIAGKEIPPTKNIAVKSASQSKSKLAVSSPEIVESAIITAKEYLQRGIIYYSKEEFNHAISNLNEAIKINPAYVEAYLYRGLSYAGQGSPDKAIVDYTTAIKINPKNEEAYFVRGIAYAAVREIDKALADYNKAIELNPKYVQAYLNRALLNMAAGNNDQAIVDANKVMEINSTFAGSYYLRGLAYANKNSLEQAISDYTKAIEMSPQYAESYANRGLARAYNIIEKAKLDPNSPIAYVNIGIAHVDKTNFDRAISDCNKAIELNPKYIEGYIMRA